MRQNLRMLANLLRTQDKLKTDGFLLSVRICKTWGEFGHYMSSFFFNLLNSNTNFILLLWKMQYF